MRSTVDSRPFLVEIGINRRGNIDQVALFRKRFHCSNIRSRAQSSRNTFSRQNKEPSRSPVAVPSTLEQTSVTMTTKLLLATSLLVTFSASQLIVPIPRPLPPKPTRPPPMSYRYRIVSQSYVFAGETLAVSIYVEKGSSKMMTDEEGNEINPFPIDVTLDVKDGQSGQNLISTVNRKVTRRQCTTIFVKLPESTPPGTHGVSVRMTSQQGAMRNFMTTFRVRPTNRMIMIQTDKPVYKPGQTILGRVIVLTSSRLTAASGKVTLQIRNSKNALMTSFKNLTLDTGVARFNFPLSSEPVLGQYALCATLEGAIQKQEKCFSVKVEEYVLPKFSCTISPKDDQFSCINRRHTVCYTVSAKYTYGQKVKGTVSATATTGNTWRRCRNEEREVVLDSIDGEKTVCVHTCTRYYITCSGEINLEANVTDPTSGDEVACEGVTKIPIRRNPYQIEIVKPQFNAFYPCQKTRYTVKTSIVSGKPYGGARVKFTCKALLKKGSKCGPDEKEIYTTEVTTNDDGRAPIEFCAPCNALDISCTAKAVGESSYISPARSGRSVLIYSPGRVMVRNSMKSLEVGNEHVFDAYFTHSGKTTAFILSKGTVLRKLSCFPDSIDVNLTDISDEICDAKRMPRPLKYYCSFQYNVTPAMIPKVTIVVGQKKLSAVNLNLPVTADSGNQMTLEFSQNQVEPGENVSLQIEAAPGSYVGVVAVDQSVYLQQAKNQLTAQQVRAEAAGFDSSPTYLPRKTFECGARRLWSCNCRQYGCKRTPSDDERSTSTTPPLVPFFPRRRFGPSCPESDCYRSVCTLIGKCEFVSALSFYEAAGLKVLSNLNAKGSPKCARSKPPLGLGHSCCPLVVSGCGSLGRRSPRCALRVTQFQKVSKEDEDADETTTELVEVKRERVNFPETWIWKDIQLEKNSRNHDLMLTAPDTITSWIADGFALSTENSISVSMPASLRVFQPFFVSLTLPYSVIRGEKLEVRATVFNYLDVNLTAFVELEVDSNEISIIESKADMQKDSRRSLTIPAGEARSIDYFVVPLKVGYLPMKCTARSTKAADAVVRPLLVEPEGVQKEYGLSSLICIEGTRNLPYYLISCNVFLKENAQNAEKVFNLTLPPAYVPDSESAVVSVTTDYMGPTIEGLENLLRLPHGCGEQNMINFAPGVYITRYLTAVGKLDEKTKEKALNIMMKGYQREMIFQRDDGSYSAFGNSDKCGSMWLTAFVVRTFSQAHGIIDVDQTVQTEAIDWMKKKQSQDGSFPSVCRVISKEMQGCSGGECSLTAYVTLALLEAGVPASDPSIVNALAFLNSTCLSNDCENNYALAVISNVFCKAAHPRADELLNKLLSCATTEGDTMYYSKENNQFCYGHRLGMPCASRSCDVETSAYALLAFKCRGDVGNSSRIVRWLLEQRNPSGGFRSTQDTVVALQALSEYAALSVANNDVKMNVRLTTDSEFSWSLTVDSSNSQDLQTLNIPTLPSTLTARLAGVGCVLIQAGVKYNIPEPPEEAAFEVTAMATMNENKGKSCSYKIRVCNRWLLKKPSSSNMALTDITLFSGFVPINSDLKDLEKKGTCQIKRIDKQDRRVRVYIDEVRQTECCFELQMKRTVYVEDLQGVPVLSYNYYDPDQSGGTMLYPREECK
ncbi:alpha-1-inhibitor 3-like isoform X2 [Oscarella lobularis]|uniref:alpha-1-inhibitor 3-like isoform X2 n=1 Tax=Oscarella lobularis TaxID=121494 RepID=UPI00331328C0